jgi:O-antigen ligase
MPLNEKTSRGKFRAPRIRVLVLPWIFLYAGGLAVFYWRYVPLIKSFQAVLLPILVLVFLLTALRIRWGTLFFIFAFPLINSIPYFFGIFGNVPHAPTALVLFLFYGLGWLVHQAFAQSKPPLEKSLAGPISLFSILVMVSGLITFWRYTNFVPFRSDSIYELTINVNSVTAGGAIMSIVFTALNYLTGIFLLVILSSLLRTREFLQKTLLALAASSAVAILCGFYQYFQNIYWGNTPLNIRMGLLNSTFKDALSFGCFLAMVLPVLLSLTLSSGGPWRIFSFLAFLGGVFMLPHAGSKSSLIILPAVVLGLLFFLLKIPPQKPRAVPLKPSRAFLALLLVIAGSSLFLVSMKTSIGEARVREFIFLRKDKALRDRYSQTWKFAGLMTRDYPLSGVGVGAFILELPNYAKAHDAPHRTTDSTENYLLQVVSEMGLIGLLFVIWIFWQIFTVIRRGWTPASRDGPGGILFFGIAFGIISFWAHLPVHTYIGNFEIKYLFWLLVAVLLALNPLRQADGSITSPDQRKKLWGLGLILIFGVVHLWNSTHSLSIKDRTERFRLAQDFGLSRPEITTEDLEFQWTTTYGAKDIIVKQPVLVLPMQVSHPDIQIRPVQARVYLVTDFFREMMLLDEITFREPGWVRNEYFLPEAVGQRAFVLIKVQRTWNPQKALGVPDQRNLGVGIGRVYFRENIGPDGIGFYEWENNGTFRWSKKRAAFEYSIQKPIIRLPLLASHPDIKDNPVEISIAVGNQAPAVFRISDNEWHDYELTAGPENAGKTVIISLTVSRTWCPSDSKVSADKRDLGIGIRR